MLIPEMYWDFCHPEVMVMERMKGVPISQIDRLRAASIDIPKLARAYKKGELKLDELVSKTYRLDQINEAIAEVESGNVMRNVIVF